MGDGHLLPFFPHSARRDLPWRNSNHHRELPGRNSPSAAEACSGQLTSFRFLGIRSSATFALDRGMNDEGLLYSNDMVIVGSARDRA